MKKLGIEQRKEKKKKKKGTLIEEFSMAKPSPGKMSLTKQKEKGKVKIKKEMLYLLKARTL